jgi:hypothetical protein
VKSRIVLTLLVVPLLIAVAIWLPREEPTLADDQPIDAPVVPPAVELTAARATAVPPYSERWELTYATPPTNGPRLTLDIGPAVDKTSPGRLTAKAGADPKPLLDRIAVVLGGDLDNRGPVPPADSQDVTLTVLGENLSEGQGDIGATVIAGAFVAQPAGKWRVYRLTLGSDGPQCFLGLNATDRLAVLLPRSTADGPEIHTRLRALLHPSGT